MRILSIQFTMIAARLSLASLVWGDGDGLVTAEVSLPTVENLIESNKVDFHNRQSSLQLLEESGNDFRGIVSPPPLWSQVGEQEVRCSFKHVDNREVNSQAVCQQLAVSNKDSYYQFRHRTTSHGKYLCATFKNCDNPGVAHADAWKVYRQEGLWHFGYVGFKCTGKRKARVSGIQSQMDCQLAAVNRGHTHFQFHANTLKCATSKTCSKKRSSAGWSIFSETPPSKCSVVAGATHNFATAEAKCESLGQTLPIILDSRANSELKATLQGRADRLLQGRADRVWLGAQYGNNSGFSEPYLLQTQQLDASISHKSAPPGGFQWLDGSMMDKGYVNFGGEGMSGSGFPSAYPGDELIFNEDGSWELTRPGDGSDFQQHGASVACCQKEEACYQWPGVFSSPSGPISHVQHSLVKELDFPMEGEFVTEQQLATLDSAGVLTEWLGDGVIQRRPCQPNCVDTDIREDHRCVLATLDGCPPWFSSYADDEDFTVTDMCCACGGGNSMVCSVASDCLDGHMCLEGFCQVSHCSVVDDTTTHSYEDANDMCQSIGKSLPIIKNRRENKALLTALQNRASSVWLGAQGPWNNHESPIEYRWVDGTTSFKDHTSDNFPIDLFEEFKGYWPEFEWQGGKFGGKLMAEAITLLDNGTWIRSNALSATNYVACCEGSMIPISTTTTTTPMNSTFNQCGKDWVVNEPVIWDRGSNQDTGISRVQCGHNDAAKIAICVGRGLSPYHSRSDWYECEGPPPKEQCEKMYWVSCSSVQHVDEVVNCGNHDATNCGDCAQGVGEEFCNGQCEWRSGQCGAITPAITPQP